MTTNRPFSSTMAEQLSPIARRLRERQSTVRPVSQVILTLKASNSARTFTETRDCVLKWMASRAGRKLPQEAWNGDSFELEEIGAQRAAAVLLDTPHYWAARLDDADKAIAQRVWATEIGMVSMQNGFILFGTRLICVTRGEDAPFDRSIPGFVRQIVETQNASVEGRQIDTIPWLVENESDVDDLVSLLTDPTRRCDTIVFALPEHSVDHRDTAASATEVHRRTYGAAHVAVITGPASYHLSDRVGKEFSVFHQGVRTYRPGFDPSQDEPFRHPLGLPDRIRNWDGVGPEAYEKLLISQALIKSVSAADIEHRLPPFLSIKRTAAQLRMEAAREAGSSDRDLLALAEEDNTSLRKALDEQKSTYDGLLLVAEEERRQATQAAEQTQARLTSLRRRIDSLELKLKTRDGQTTQPEIPDNLDGFQNWCETHLSGAVELHNRAYQGVKKSQFNEPKLLYRALLLLRDHYAPMRQHGGLELKQAFESACQELGLEESSTFSGERWGEEGDTYVVRYAGRKCLLDRHLKNGNSRDPRYCFRLYFFWDEADEQIVVGWLPSHLDNRMT